MINQNELEGLGFKLIAEEPGLWGNTSTFYKKVDNGHIIEGHDTAEIFITKNRNFISIEIDHQSSWDYSGKRLVFTGKCDSIDFLQQIIKAVI